MVQWSVEFQRQPVGDRHVLYVEAKRSSSLDKDIATASGGGGGGSGESDLVVDVVGVDEGDGEAFGC